MSTTARVVEMAINKSVVLLGVVLASLLLGFQDVVYVRELTDKPMVANPSLSLIFLFVCVLCYVTA